jgi:hypothetical protein
LEPRRKIETTSQRPRDTNTEARMHEVPDMLFGITGLMQ